MLVVRKTAHEDGVGETAHTAGWGRLRTMLAVEKLRTMLVVRKTAHDAGVGETAHDAGGGENCAHC
jgi:hypothetical protein